MKWLVIALTVGLVWQAVVVAFLVWRETGTLAWSVVRRALWLRRPQSPRSGRVGGRVVMLVFTTVAGEELLFRGILLPRMQRIGGRFAWLWNAALFALYHVHQPWTMPNVLVSATVFAYTTQRYRSAWFGIALHSVQSVVAIALLLGLVTGALTL